MDKMPQIQTIIESRQVLLNGKEVALTAREYDLWLYLQNHTGCVCTRQKILDDVWGARFAYDTGTIDVHIHSLRRKLHLSPEIPIRTIRGIGYIYNEQAPTTVPQNMDWARLFTALMPNQLTACNLQAFINDLLHAYTPLWQAHAMHVTVHLDPFVNSIITDHDTLRAIYDLLLPMLLTESSTLTLSSILTREAFTLSIEGQGEPDQERLLAAQRFAALLGMAMRISSQDTSIRIEMTLLMKK